MKYELGNETREVRCAWCWERSGANEPHVVITALGSPPLSLRFHRECWPVYRNVSGVELTPKGVTFEWTPILLEKLRMHCGLTVALFAKRLKIGPQHYQGIMESRFPINADLVNNIRHVAALNRFHADTAVDWSDRRALFCLRMHLGLSWEGFASKAGVAPRSVLRWCADGIPPTSLRAWSRFAKLAQNSKFDRGMVVDDRLWTPEYLRIAVEQSGESMRAWDRLAGYKEGGSVQRFVRGGSKILRSSAWRLTRAAAAMGIELPPPGVFAPEVLLGSGSRPATNSHNFRHWTAEEIALLGTATDTEIGARLGRRARSVGLKRAALGIPKVYRNEREARRGMKMGKKEPVLVAEPEGSCR